MHNVCACTSVYCMFRFIQTAESLKPSCITDSKVVNPDKSELEEYYPQIGM